MPELYEQTTHSAVIYLMSSSNHPIGIYNLDIDSKELADQVTEEISYDIGIRHIGKNTRPYVKR